MALCSCMSTKVSVARRLLSERTPRANCEVGRRKQQPVVCGSKSSKKRLADKDSPAQDLKSQESRESDVSTNLPSNIERDLSRSGKPIGWKVLPRETPQQAPVHEEVLP